MKGSRKKFLSPVSLSKPTHSHDFFTNDDDSTGLSNNSVFAVYEDRRGTVWVGTEFGLIRFNPATTLEFSVPVDGRATIKVHDMLSREVATVFNDVVKAGYYHQATFDASRVTSGIYFARPSTPHFPLKLLPATFPAFN